MLEAFAWLSVAALIVGVMACLIWAEQVVDGLLEDDRGNWE